MTNPRLYPFEFNRPRRPEAYEHNPKANAGFKPQRHSLSGSVTAVATVSGSVTRVTLNTQHDIAGILSCDSNLSANLGKFLRRNLRGDLTASGTMTGDLTKTLLVEHALSGTLSASATMTGDAAVSGNTPPAVVDLSVSPTDTTVRIQFSTDEFASAEVFEGVTSKGTSPLGLDHDITVSGLSSETSYAWTLKVTDSQLAETTVAINFTTLITPPIGTISEITRHNITWRFATPVTAGQYVNGDWWVLGPVSVSEIIPKTQYNSGVSNGVTIGWQHGSHVNPPATGQGQGWGQSNTLAYNLANNWANGVSPGNPKTLNPNESLVSSYFPPTIVYNAQRRPMMWTAAVLTCVSTPPPANAFRPPYVGTDKTSYFTESDLDYSNLGSYTLVGSNIWSFETCENKTERLWLDTAQGWHCQDIAPYINMPNYGRNLSEVVGACGLLLNSDASNAAKRNLLVNLVQIGLDMYGLSQNGGDDNWYGSGGLSSGRLFLILFAGKVLNNAAMIDVRQQTNPTIRFHVIDQHHYVTQADVDRTIQGDPRDVVLEQYEVSDIGTPEWGIEYRRKPWLSNRWWGTYYRQCCNSNAYWGWLLSLYMMGITDKIAHQAFLDYQDRYNTVQGASTPPGHPNDWLLFWQSRWQYDNWTTYRGTF